MAVQNSITKSVANQSVMMTDEDLAILTQAGVIPKGTPAPQVQIFAKVCAERGLSPFSKEVYLVGYSGNYSIITGINGFRKIAAETGKLAGVDDAKFDLLPDGTYKTAAQYGEKEKPKTATVTVYRAVGGQRVPFTHTAVFREFASSGKWATMPFQMIAKVAEAFALRKGFSDLLTGINVEEELGAIQGQTAAVVEKKEAVIEKARKEYNRKPLSEENADAWESKFAECADFDAVMQIWRDSGLGTDYVEIVQMVVGKATNTAELFKAYKALDIDAQDAELGDLFTARKNEIAA